MMDWIWFIKNLLIPIVDLSTECSLACTCKEVKKFIYDDTRWRRRFVELKVEKEYEALVKKYSNWRELYIDYFLYGTS